MTASYDPVPSSADEAINRDLGWLLRDKDQRFAAATPASVETLTPERFKEIWAPVLASGPIEIQVFGAVKADDVIETVRKTFGALPPRPATQPAAANVSLKFPAHNDKPVVLQYFDFLGRLMHGDFGNSVFTGRPVMQDLASVFPATLELATIGILIGVLAKMLKQNGLNIGQNRLFERLRNALPVLPQSRHMETR